MTEGNNSTDTSTETGTTTATATTDASTMTDTGTTAETDHAAEAEKWKNLARKHEERAKANAGAVKELEQLRQQSMNDQEKAVATAKAEGKAEAMATTGARLVKAEVKAAAAGRFSDEQLTALLAGLSAVAFLTEDGDVDEDKVKKFVDGIAPSTDEGTTTATSPSVPDLGQGARGGGAANAALNGDPLLRDLKAKLGIR